MLAALNCSLINSCVARRRHDNGGTTRGVDSKRFMDMVLVAGYALCSGIEECTALLLPLHIIYVIST